MRIGSEGRTLRGLTRPLLVVGAIALAAVVYTRLRGQSTSIADAGAGAPGEATGPALPPVAAPDGLLAEAALLDPAPFWSRLQRGVGATLGILPTSPGGLLVALAGVDPAFGPELDGASPAFAVVATDPADDSELAWAVAFRVSDARRAKNVLVEGDVSRYAVHDVGGMAALAPRGGAHLSVGAALAPGGFFVVARNEADLARLGPYLTRSVPTKAHAPTNDGSLLVEVPKSALSGVVRARLAAAWSSFRAEKEKQDEDLRQAHGGRAPDFADPRAILATVDAVVNDRLALLGDLEGARVVVAAGEDDLRATVSLAPSPGDGPAARSLEAMQVGDALPMLEAPADAPLLALARSAPDGRAADAELVSDAVAKALGPRLSAADGKRLRGALDDIERGRGDWLVAGLSARRPAGAAYLRAPAADADTLARGIKEALELESLPAFKGPLAAFLHAKDPTFAQADAGAAGRADVATFAYEGGKTLVAWGVRDGVLTACAGDDAPAKLSSIGAPEHKLASDERVAGALRGFASDVTLAVVARPLGFDEGRVAAAAEAPFLLGWGRRGAAFWLRVEASDLLAREAVRRASGL